jgi:ADP-ribosyl-[dinitrogen reductase] hydrolase
MVDKTNRIIGCILGGAIGDCIGGPYEGLAKPARVGIQHQWRISDDTQMTLATCEAITQCGRVDPAVIAATFGQWHKHSRITGIGGATYKALTELNRGGHWVLVGMKGQRAVGNGAAMRIAPLAFCLDPANPEERKTIRDVSRITHHNEEAYVGALAVALAIRYAWRGDWDGGRSLIPSIADQLPDSSVRDRLIAIDGCDEISSLRDVADRFGCSGYVVESVPLALCAAQRLGEMGLSAMIIEVISVGGDADTIASITGQIAGAFIGRGALPKELVARLPDLPGLERTAKKFAEVVNQSPAQG